MWETNCKLDHWYGLDQGRLRPLACILYSELPIHPCLLIVLWFCGCLQWPNLQHKRPLLSTILPPPALCNINSLQELAVAHSSKSGDPQSDQFKGQSHQPGIGKLAMHARVAPQICRWGDFLEKTDDLLQSSHIFHWIIFTFTHLLDGGPLWHGHSYAVVPKPKEGILHCTACNALAFYMASADVLNVHLQAARIKLLSVSARTVLVLFSVVVYM